VADPPTSSQQPVPEEPEVDPEVGVVIRRAVEYLEQGRRLPRPASWKELLAGMVVYLGTHWSTEDQERRPCGNCGAQAWEYGPVVAFDADPRWPPPETGVFGSYPYFQVGCRECGNTMFISERLDHVAALSRAGKWTPRSHIAMGAVGGGFIGLVPFLVVKPPLLASLAYVVALAVALYLGLTYSEAAEDIASERADSILAIKEHIDNTMLTTETPRLQAPTSARRLGSPEVPVAEQTHQEPEAPLPPPD
jgi:hypothetical protein